MMAENCEPCYAVQSVALDPRYGSRRTREIATGGLAGQLLFSSKANRMKRLARTNMMKLLKSDVCEGPRMLRGDASAAR